MFIPRLLACPLLAASFLLAASPRRPFAASVATPATRPAAEYEARASAIRQSLPKGFTILIQPPFVVIGDGTPESVQSSATGTIKWAVDHLKKDYFTQDPTDLIDIYLFKDKPSYDKHTWELFKEHPASPYGYYSPSQKVLLMNISTGGGTLVHEIVHPFMAANFPNCPTWFNEGLASLYEQSAEKDGHIVGLTNWRLPALQTAITNKKLPPFKDLFAMDPETFYTQDKGTNYAQSRYLLYYLQEKSLLHTYYHAVLKNQSTDPTGLETLKITLNEPNLDPFQQRWQKYVLTLHFP